MEAKWLSWAKTLQAMAQSGLAYTTNIYDRERYEALRELSVEIMDTYTEAGTEKIKDLFCNEVGYQTPKIDVRGALFKEQKVLLVKEKLDGLWSLPGGWADVGLSIKDNVKKEMVEEAGLVIEPTRLVGIYDWTRNSKETPFSIYKAVMICDYISGEFKDNIETEEIGYFGLDELPPLSHRVSYKMIEKSWHAYNDIEWMAEVD